MLSGTHILQQQTKTLIQEHIMKKMLISLALAATLTTPFVTAKEASSEKQANTAVQFRQAVLQLVRSNMGPLGAMAKGQIDYDAEVMRVNAMRIEQLSLMMGDYFELDTRKFSVKTEAADAIAKLVMINLKQSKQ